MIIPEFIKEIELLIKGLESELKFKEEEHRKKRDIFKKQARIVLLEINWIRGNINSAQKILARAKKLRS